MYYNYFLLNPLKKGNFTFKDLDICFLYEPFYVGKGKNYRYKDHLYNCNIDNTIKGKIIKKIFINNKKPLVLIINKNDNEQECLNNEINLISKIGRIKLNTDPLSNLTDGGEGLSGYKPSEETLEKLRLSHLGYKATQSTKDKMSLSQKGKIRSIENCLNYSNKKPIIQYEDIKSQISFSLKNKNYRKKKTNESFQVEQIDPIANEVLNIFKNSVEASVYITDSNKFASSIRKCCKGLRKICKGYKWNYIIND